MPSSRQQGFTLTEMLVTIVIGVLLVGLTANLITSHFRMIGTEQTLQRLHQRWLRVNQLIRADIQEGVSLSTSATVPAACGASGSAILSINLPEGEGIHYIQRTTADSTDLWRCGPEVNADGSLGSYDPTTEAFTPNPLQNSRIASRATLSITPLDVAATQEVNYQLSLSSPVGGRDVTYTASSAEATTGRRY